MNVAKELEQIHDHPLITSLIIAFFIGVGYEIDDLSVQKRVCLAPSGGKRIVKDVGTFNAAIHRQASESGLFLDEAALMEADANIAAGRIKLTDDPLCVLARKPGDGIMVRGAKNGWRLIKFVFFTSPSAAKN